MEKPDDSSQVHFVNELNLTLLELLFDQVQDVAYFVKNNVGQYISVNESLINRHGLKAKEEALGKRPIDICPGEFGRVPAEQDERVLRTRRPILNHLEMQWHKPHEPVWCLTTKLPILASDGKVLGIVGFSRDVRLQVPPEDIPESFANTLEFFQENLCEITTPSKLAEKSKLSLQRLNRLTKQLFGLTAGQLITKMRIAAASRMLIETTMSVSNVSLACGFFDQSAFTRAFRSATGVTPSTFRRRASRMPSPQTH